MRSLGEIALFTDDVAGASAFNGGLIGAAPVADWPGGAIFASARASCSSTSALLH